MRSKDCNGYLCEAGRARAAHPKAPRLDDCGVCPQQVLGAVTAAQIGDGHADYRRSLRPGTGVAITKPRLGSDAKAADVVQLGAAAAHQQNSSHTMKLVLINEHVRTRDIILTRDQQSCAMH